MDFLNSQHLTYQDGYLHVFRSPGTYTYRVDVLPREFEASSDGSTYTIEVSEGDSPVGEGNQHDVVMRWAAERRAYYPEPAQVSISVNDFVLWRVETDIAAIPPYSVRGESKGKEEFDSRALGLHDVFTHMFMTAGQYSVQINGKAAGRISVRDHREIEPEAYARQTQDAPLVRILNGKPRPASLDIVTGQTVIWLVERGNQVTIVAEADRGDKAEAQTALT